MLTPQTATRTHGDYAVTKYATPDGYRYVVFHLGERVAVCASYDEAREYAVIVCRDGAEKN